jgi:hypothetical protein
MASVIAGVLVLLLAPSPPSSGQSLKPGDRVRAGVGALIRVERWAPVSREPTGAMARIELGAHIGR